MLMRPRPMTMSVNCSRQGCRASSSNRSTC
jgi:hypothetical protein